MNPFRLAVALALVLGSFGLASEGMDCQTLNRQAVDLLDNNRLAEAEALVSKLLASPADELCRAAALNNHAIVLWRQGRLAQAAAIANQALAIFEQTVGADSPVLARPLQNLAQIAAEQRSHPLAARLLARLEAIPTQVHEDLAIRLSLRAGALAYEERVAEARAKYLEAIGHWEQGRTLPPSSMVPDLGNLAILALNQGRFAEAVAFVERAVTHLAPAPREMVLRIRTLALAAIALAGNGNRSGAQAYYDQVMPLLPELPVHQAPLGRTICAHYKSFLEQTGHKRGAKTVDRLAHDLFGPNPADHVVDVNTLAAKGKSR